MVEAVADPAPSDSCALGASSLGVAPEPRAAELTDELAQLEAELREMEARLGVQVPDSPVQGQGSEREAAPEAVTASREEADLAQVHDKTGEEKEDAVGLEFEDGVEEEEDAAADTAAAAGAADLDLSVDPELEALLLRYRGPSASSGSTSPKPAEPTTGRAALAMLGEREAELEREVRQLQLELSGEGSPGGGSNNSRSASARPPRLETIQEETAEATWDYTPQGVVAADMSLQEDHEEELRHGLDGSNSALALDLAALSLKALQERRDADEPDEEQMLQQKDQDEEEEEAAAPQECSSLGSANDERRPCPEPDRQTSRDAGEPDKDWLSQQDDQDEVQQVVVATAQDCLSPGSVHDESSFCPEINAQEDRDVDELDEGSWSPQKNQDEAQDLPAVDEIETDSRSARKEQHVMKCPRDFTAFAGLPPPLPPLPAATLSPSHVECSEHKLHREVGDAKDGEVDVHAVAEADYLFPKLQESKDAREPHADGVLQHSSEHEIEDGALDVPGKEECAAAPEAEEARVAPGRRISDTLDSQDTLIAEEGVAASGVEEPRISPGRGISDTLDSLSADLVQHGVFDTLDVEECAVHLSPHPVPSGVRFALEVEECSTAAQPMENQQSSDLVQNVDLDAVGTEEGASPVESEGSHISLDLVQHGVLDTLDVEECAVHLSPQPVPSVGLEALDAEESSSMAQPQETKQSSDLVQNADLDALSTKDCVSPAKSEGSRLSLDLVQHGVLDTLDVEECAVHLSPHPVPSVGLEALDAEECSPAAQPRETRESSDPVQNADLDAVSTEEPSSPAKSEGSRLSLDLAQHGVLDTLDVEECAVHLSPHPVPSVELDALGAEECSTAAQPREEQQSSDLVQNADLDALSTKDCVSPAKSEGSRLSLDLVQHGVLDTLDVQECAVHLSPHLVPNVRLDALDAEECFNVAQPREEQQSIDLVQNAALDAMGIEDGASPAKSEGSRLSLDLVQHGILDTLDVEECAVHLSPHPVPSVGLNALGAEECSPAVQPRETTHPLQSGAPEYKTLDVRESELELLVSPPQMDLLGTEASSIDYKCEKRPLFSALAQHGVPETPMESSAYLSPHPVQQIGVDALDFQNDTAAPASDNDFSDFEEDEGIDACITHECETVAEVGAEQRLDCSAQDTVQYGERHLNAQHCDESGIALERLSQTEIVQAEICADVDAQELGEADRRSPVPLSAQRSFSNQMMSYGEDDVKHVEHAQLSSLPFASSCDVSRRDPVNASDLHIAASSFPSSELSDCASSSSVAHGNMQQSAQELAQPQLVFETNLGFKENQIVAGDEPTAHEQQSPCSSVHPSSPCDVQRVSPVKATAAFRYPYSLVVDMKEEPCSQKAASAQLTEQRDVVLTTPEQSQQLQPLNMKMEAPSDNLLAEEFEIELDCPTVGVVPTEAGDGEATCRTCRTQYMPDSRFCRMCGQKREFSSEVAVQSALADQQPLESCLHPSRTFGSEKRSQGNLEPPDLHTQSCASNPKPPPVKASTRRSDVRSQHQRGGDFLKSVFALNVEEPAAADTQGLQPSPLRSSASSASQGLQPSPLQSSSSSASQKSLIIAEDPQPRGTQCESQGMYGIFSIASTSAEPSQAMPEAAVAWDAVPIEYKNFPQPEESPVEQGRGLYGNIHQQYDEQRRQKKREKQEKQDRLKREEKLKKQERLARLGMAPPAHRASCPLPYAAQSLPRSSSCSNVVQQHAMENRVEKHGMERHAASASASSLKLPPLVGDRKCEAMNAVDEDEEVSFQGVKVKLPMMPQHTSKRERSSMPEVRTLQQTRGGASSSSAPSLSLNHGGRGSITSKQSRPTLESLEKQKARLASKMELLSVFHDYHNKVENMSADQLQSLLKQLHGNRDAEESPSHGMKVQRRLRQIDRVCKGLF